MPDDDITAFWGPRAETPEEAGKKLSATLVRLAELDIVPEWYRLGKAHPTEADRIDSSPEGLAALIAKGVLRNDTDRAIMPGGGYLISFWDGYTGGSVSFDLAVGKTSQNSSAKNWVGFSVDDATRWRAAADDIFTALIQIWEPRNAIWDSREYRDNQQRIKGFRGIGWHTYLPPDDAARLHDLPPGVTTGAIANGIWLKTGDEPGPLSIARAAEIVERYAESQAG